MRRLLPVLICALALVFPAGAAAFTVTQLGADKNYLTTFWNAAERVPLPASGSAVVRTVPLPCGVATYSCSDRAPGQRVVYIGAYGPHPTVSLMYELGVFYADRELDLRERAAFARVIDRPRFNVARFADVYAWCATWSTAAPWRTYYWNSGKLKGSRALAACGWLKGFGVVS